MRKLAAVLMLGTVALAGAALAWSQGGPGGGRGRGCGARWQAMTPSDRQQVADLHQAIRRAQWEVVGLRLNEADPTTLAAKTQRLAELRDRLHKVMAATRPATCPLVDCPAPGGRCGWGCCLGQGAGAGRRANCPWRQPTGSPPK